MKLQSCSIGEPVIAPSPLHTIVMRAPLLQLDDVLLRQVSSMDAAEQISPFQAHDGLSAEARIHRVDEDVPNKLSASIRRIEFRGAMYRADFEVVGLPIVEVAVEFASGRYDDLSLTPGQKVALSLSPQHLMAFADTA